MPRIHQPRPVDAHEVHVGQLALQRRQGLAAQHGAAGQVQFDVVAGGFGPQDLGRVEPGAPGAVADLEARQRGGRSAVPATLRSAADSSQAPPASAA